MKEPQPLPRSQTLATASDITCDLCSLGQKKATKSCLTCLASYCDEHVKPHYIIPVLQKHELTSATMPIEEKVCAQHRKWMDLYCRTDKALICTECTVNKHKGHKFVSILKLEQKTKVKTNGVTKVCSNLHSS